MAAYSKMQKCDGRTAKVPNPIEIGTIQVKVKNNIYSSIDDFTADVVLLYQNRVEFNGVDHIITSAALEVRDTILDALEEGKGRTRLRESNRVNLQDFGRFALYGGI
jgi:Bromodomain